jgi:exodeoxyribonuclease VII small subunit
VTDADQSHGPGEQETELGYAEALSELEEILAELEGGDVDIDRLAGRVRRAAELLERCRGRIEDARLEVTRVVAGLAPETVRAPADDTSGTD